MRACAPKCSAISTSISGTLTAGRTTTADSRTHAYGRRARSAVERARHHVSAVIVRVQTLRPALAMLLLGAGICLFGAAIIRAPLILRPFVGRRALATR